MQSEIEQAVEKYSNLLLRAAYVVLHNTQDAQDAVQETFLKRMTRAPRFRDDAHEKAWLLRVTINTAKNIRRANARDSDASVPDIPVTEKQNDVLDAVFRLPTAYRTAVFLYYYEGYSIREIAGILAVPQATVGTRLSRARDKLKEMLGEEI